MDLLYPMRGASRPERNRPRVYPAAIKEKMLPLKAWLRDSCSSIIGKKGERMVRVEKFVYHRNQKNRSRRIFMAGTRVELAAIFSIPF